MKDCLTLDPEQIKAYAEAEVMSPEEVVETFFQDTRYCTPTGHPRRVAMHEMVDGEWKHCIVDTETGTVEYPEGEGMDETGRAVVE